MENTNTGTQSSTAWRGRVNNAAIKARRWTINALLKISDDLFLNGAPPVSGQVESGDVIAEINQTIRRFKEQAISPDGQHVDYTAIRHSDVYQHYRRQVTPLLRAINLDELRNRKAATAFWINLYNALVIDGVIHANISTSITAGFLRIMRFFNRTAYNVGGMRFSLEDIENGILRANRGSVFVPGAHFSIDDPRFKLTLAAVDPRVHFALNCASKSCPPINAYSEEHLDEQLDAAAGNFLDQEVRLDKEKGRLFVTTLLKWYQADFGGKPGVYEFLREN
ncbi:MAG: DUF547 domain-containing protein, partial [Chloroflexi bacterium]|nr:DUF547 domain-containing protein [Chloroflexota bacterium]